MQMADRKLASIFQEFQIQSKVVNVVTAFSLFHPEVTEQSESADGSESGDGDDMGEDVPVMAL